MHTITNNKCITVHILHVHMDMRGYTLCCKSWKHQCGCFPSHVHPVRVVVVLEPFPGLTMGRQEHDLDRPPVPNRTWRQPGQGKSSSSDFKASGQWITTAWIVQVALVDRNVQADKTVQPVPRFAARVSKTPNSIFPVYTCLANNKKRGFEDVDLTFSVIDLIKSFSETIPLRVSLNKFQIPFESVQSQQTPLSGMHKHHRRQIHGFASNCFHINIPLWSYFAFICFEKGMGYTSERNQQKQTWRVFKQRRGPLLLFLSPKSGWRLTWVTLTLFFKTLRRKWKMRNVNQRHSQPSACNTSLNHQEN